MALLSILSNTTLVVLKLAVGWMTGAVSIIAEGVHSGMDLVAAIIAWLSVRVADRPPDREHPFGHGKIENLSGLAEALLISAAAVLIVKESLEKMSAGTDTEMLEWGIAVMGVSAVLNTVVSYKLFRTAKRTDSMALLADAEHLRTDVITSLGVFAGLALIKITGYHILDPIAAMAVAGLIFHISIKLIWQTVAPLIDSTLPEREREIINESLKECDPKVVGWHKIRTRKSGSWRFIDLHVQVKSDLTVLEAHELVDEIENCIKDALPKSHVLVHVEPEEEAAPEDLRFPPGDES